jgi:hypothetical protein
MNKTLTVELTERQARQIWHLLNFSTNSISSAIETAGGDSEHDKYMYNLMGEQRLMTAWFKMSDALEEAGVDPHG